VGDAVIRSYRMQRRDGVIRLKMFAEQTIFENRERRSSSRCGRKTRRRQDKGGRSPLSLRVSRRLSRPQRFGVKSSVSRQEPVEIIFLPITLLAAFPLPV